MPVETKTLNFPKSEKLCSKNSIDELFTSGKSMYFQHFKLIYRFKYDEPITGVKVMITVPKKYIKLAVGRNRIKRLIRESFRLNKHILLEVLMARKQSCDIAILYTSNAETSLDNVQTAIKTLLKRLVTTNEENFK